MSKLEVTFSELGKGQRMAVGRYMAKVVKGGRGTSQEKYWKTPSGAEFCFDAQFKHHHVVLSHRGAILDKAVTASTIY